jgi:hypothetical protein
MPPTAARAGFEGRGNYSIPLFESRKRLIPAMPGINVKHDKAGCRTRRDSDVCVRPLLKPSANRIRICARVFEAVLGERQFPSHRKNWQTAFCISHRCVRNVHRATFAARSIARYASKQNFL